MNIKIDKAFEQDIDSISNKSLRNRVADKIEAIEKATRLTDITNCKKLKNSHNAYRIKIGDYRAGFEFENNTIVFIRFLHRSKIYNFFPR